MNNHLRKLILLGSVLLLSTLMLLPVTQANRGNYLNQPIATLSSINASTANSNTAALSSFANTNPISVPGAGTTGQASPYPSVINVAGVSGTVAHVAIKLVNVSHTFPDDMDVLLVSPTGQNLIMMSDAGGGVDLVNNTITIDDAAGSALPDNSAIGTGTFRPTNYNVGDTFSGVLAPYSSPEPSGVATSASVFGGSDPNGNWQLYIVDDASGDPGIVNGGWELIITTDGGGGNPCILTCPSDITVGTDPDSCRAVVNYPNVTVQGDCGTVTYSHPSGSTFPIGTTTVTVTATQSDMSTQTCSFNVTVTNNNPPTVTTSVAVSSLGQPFDHTLVNVGLSSSATANCSNVGPVQIAVYSNEDDDSSGDGNFSPDATDIAIGTLRLRRERTGSGAGRIYLIISSATDASGNTAFSCNTVTVPLNNDAAATSAVNTQAAAAAAQCQATGTPPSGYVVIGDSQASGLSGRGPKQ